MSTISTQPREKVGGMPTFVRTPARPRNVAVTLLLLLTLPAFVYYLWYCVAFERGQLALPSLEMLRQLPMPTVTSAGIVSGWLIGQILLQLYAPGKWMEGPQLSDGTRLKYKMNGWFSWWFTWTILVFGAVFGFYSPTKVADQFGALLTTVNIFTYILCFYLYWHGKRAGGVQEHSAKDAVNDFWLGTALNPRVGNFDFKLFFEARPGLIAWIALDLACAAKQYQLHGFVSLPMILVCAFHFWYVADYFFHEEAILTTWDIKHEAFGWMLCWGDLVWVPFTYTIQAYYLVDHTHDLPWWATFGIVLLNLIGYVIFRGANSQKHRFRNAPDRPLWGRPAEYIAVPHGSLILTSGWWGLSRHMNYFGDLLMALAWCLPCLFGSPIPYFYVLYLTVLLVHRERRDNNMCAARYGTDWEAYCAKVPYRIIPRIY